MSQPLFMVTGSCLGHEIQLDMDHIPFGTVCHGSQTSRHILIINSGDIGARLACTIYKSKRSHTINVPLWFPASSGSWKSLLQISQFHPLKATSRQEWRYIVNPYTLIHRYTLITHPYTS